MSVCTGSSRCHFKGISFERCLVLYALRYKFVQAVIASVVFDMVKKAPKKKAEAAPRKAMKSIKKAVKAIKAKKAMKAIMKTTMKAMKAVSAKKTTAAPKKAVKAMKAASYQSRHIDTQPNWLLMKDFVQRLLKCHVLSERRKWKHDILTDFMFDLMLHRRFIIAHHEEEDGRHDRTPWMKLD